VLDQKESFMADYFLIPRKILSQAAGYSVFKDLWMVINQLLQRAFFDAPL
jgi:hypothetical protein